MQQFQQGMFLRDRYHEFLEEPFSTESVHVQSTDVDRTIMSAQLTLAGLFPPQGSQIWNRELDWQPVPVHQQPLNQDSVSIVIQLIHTRCPNSSATTIIFPQRQDIDQWNSRHTFLLYLLTFLHIWLKLSTPVESNAWGLRRPALCRL